MTETTCRSCGGRMLQIPGWPPRLHPECLPAGYVAWSRQQMAEWLAARERNIPDLPPTSAVGATKGSAA